MEKMKLQFEQKFNENSNLKLLEEQLLQNQRAYIKNIDLVTKPQLITEDTIKDQEEASKTGKLSQRWGTICIAWAK